MDMHKYVTTLDITKDKLADQPSYIRKQLKPHQLMMLAKCLSVENGFKVNDEQLFYLTVGSYVHDITEYWVDIKSKFGAICDPVGSGKTLVVLSLISQPLEVQTITNHEHIGETAMFKTSTNYSLDLIRTKIEHNKYSVIVVPHTLISQWKRTLDEDTDIKYITYSKGKCIKEIKTTQKNKDFDVILLSNSNHNDFFDKYWEVKFKRVFYDEADSIKLPNCKKLDSNFYWFVTASCKSLHENFSYKNKISCNGFIKNTFYKSDNLFSKHVILRNDEDFIHKSFKLEDYKKIVIQCQRHQLLHVLSNHVSDRVQQMICAGDIESAIMTFNITNASEDNLVSIVCNDLVTQLDNKKAKLQYALNKTYSSEDAKKESIEKIRKSIQKLEDSIDSITRKIKESDLDPITYMEIENPVVTKCCKTSFDFESITMYILSKPNPLCPICRTPITKDDLVMISNRENNKEDPDKEWKFEQNKKIFNIKYLIDSMDYAARIIIFSEFDSTIHTLFKELSNYTIKQIKGHIHSIDKTIEWFKDNTTMDKRILFMNSQYAGAGINLENGTDIFIYHSMGSDLTKQVIGRCHRPGRTSILNVYGFEE